MTESLWLPTDHLAGPFSGDKVLLHCDTLSALQRGEIPPPVTVEFDATNVCNLDCPYCTNAQYRKENKAALPRAVALDVIDDWVTMGAKAVTFTGGGEPLLYPTLPLLMRNAKAGGMDVALITNGVYLDSQHIDLDFLAQACTWIRVSLDAYDPESYVHSKGKNHYCRVVANIKALVAAKKRTKSLCTIGVGFLTEDAFSPYISGVAASFAGSGVDYVQFRPMTFLADDSRGESVQLGLALGDIKAAKRYETESYKVYCSLPKYMAIEQGEAKRPYSYCSGVYFAAVVGATGDVWACCHMRGNERFSLGNVKERSFRAIWQDAETRNAVYRRIGDFSECMPLCRFHGQNKLLASMNWQPQHGNFL